MAGWAQGMALAGETLFVADESGGLHIADISDPAHPVEVGAFYALGDARDVVVDGNRGFVTDGLCDRQSISVSIQSGVTVQTDNGTIVDRV